MELREKFEDIKGVITGTRRRTDHAMEKNKRTNNYVQNTTRKTRRLSHTNFT